MMASDLSQPNMPRIDMPRLLIALMAPADVDRFARQITQELSDRYGTRTAKVAPHITLQAPFRWSRDRLSALEQGLTNFAQTYQPIPMELNGFGSFGKKVLYIHVESSPALMDVQSSLANYLDRTFKVVDPKAHKWSFSPHMTVASRKLTPLTFDQAWVYLQQYSVEFQYVSDRLTLLIHDEYKWHIHRDFRFAH